MKKLTIILLAILLSSCAARVIGYQKDIEGNYEFESKTEIGKLEYETTFYQDTITFWPKKIIVSTWLDKFHEGDKVNVTHKRKDWYIVKKLK